MPLIISLISLCLCVFFFFFFRWYIKQKTAARELLVDYRTEVHNLIADIDTATDRDSLLVEERIKTVKQLLEDTDRRIAVYVRELQRSRNSEMMYSSLGRGIRVALDSSPPQGTAPETPDALFPSEMLVTQEAPKPPEKKAARESTNQPAGKRQKKQKTKLKTHIAEMSAKGLDPHEIASRLGLSLAEVDLALNLLNPQDVNQ